MNSKYMGAEFWVLTLKKAVNCFYLPEKKLVCFDIHVCANIQRDKYTNALYLENIVEILIYLQWFDASA